MELNHEERAVLQKMAGHRGGVSREARRARILLLAAEGYTTLEICDAVGCSHQTVSAWRRRFQHHGLAGLRRPGA